MTDTAELTHLDESVLEDECKCEVNHTVTTCSYKVTHFWQNCQDSQLICWNAYRRLIGRPEWRNIERYDCLLCHRPAEDCWTIRPV